MLVALTWDVCSKMSVSGAVAWGELRCMCCFGAGQAMAFAPLSALSMIGMAFVMSFNFMALHETVHRSAFKSRMWNDVFMHVSGLLTMRPVCIECRPCVSSRPLCPRIAVALLSVGPVCLLVPFVPKSL
jgi:hypothetical protein